MLVPPQCREVFQPIVVEECVTVVGGYLKQPLAVITHKHCDRLFVMLEHCDWVCKLVTGKGRGRTPLKDVYTLRNLRELAQRHLADVFSASALAEDPLLAVDGAMSSSSAQCVGYKRQRMLHPWLQPSLLVLPAADVAPSGYPAFSRQELHVLVWLRKHTHPAVCVLREHLPLVLDFLRHEIES